MLPVNSHSVELDSPGLPSAIACGTVSSLLFWVQTPGCLAHAAVLRSRRFGLQVLRNKSLTCRSTVRH